MDEQGMGNEGAVERTAESRPTVDQFITPPAPSAQAPLRPPHVAPKGMHIVNGFSVTAMVLASLALLFALGSYGTGDAAGLTCGLALPSVAFALVGWLYARDRAAALDGDAGTFNRGIAVTVLVLAVAAIVFAALGGVASDAGSRYHGPWSYQSEPSRYEVMG